jgi:hypothetical protein
MEGQEPREQKGVEGQQEQKGEEAPLGLTVQVLEQEAPREPKVQALGQEALMEGQEPREGEEQQARREKDLAWRQACEERQLELTQPDGVAQKPTIPMKRTTKTKMPLEQMAAEA